VNPLFVDTLPNPQAAEGGDAQGERQGGRRRNRRGGRGRDRDDARPGERGEGANGADAQGETMQSSVDAFGSARAENSDSAATDAASSAQRHEGADAQGGEGAATEPRGEGSRRRGRGRGRDRERAPREGESIGGPAFGADRSESVDPMFVPFSGGLEAGRETDDGDRGDEAVRTAPPSPRAAPEMPHEPSSEPWRAQEPAQSAPVVERNTQSLAPQPAAMSMAPATPYSLPLDSLVAVAESAGLQWVNSDAAKIEAAQAAMAAAAEPIRVPRDIPPVAAMDDGPLVLVETKKDLSQVKLPFETTPRETQGL
jgi:ribonuclease E